MWTTRKRTVRSIDQRLCGPLSDRMFRQVVPFLRFELGNSEIKYFDRITAPLIGFKPDIVRFKIAVNDAFLVRFMNGPCTCEIKAANLGVDLISNWDWEALVPGAGPPPKAMEPGGYVTLEDE